jgi:hypothetical protein
VDAIVNAIESEVNSGAELLLFSVNAITTGTQSQGEDDAPAKSRTYRQWCRC